MRTQQNKETFHTILPEDIGGIIQSFNCCDNCNRFMKWEDHYEHDHLNKQNLTTFGRQLFMLKQRDNFDLYFTVDGLETKNKNY